MDEISSVLSTSPTGQLTSGFAVPSDETTSSDMESDLEFERLNLEEIGEFKMKTVIEYCSRFEKLDEASTVDILSRLSVYSLFQCRAVCRNWRRIIVYDSYFAKIHSNRSIQTHSKIINTMAPEPFDDSGLSYIIQVNLCTGNNLLFVEGGLMSKHATIINCHFDRFWPPYIDPIDLYHFQIGPSCNGLLCLRLGHNGYHEPVAVCNPVTGEYVSLPEIDDSPGEDVVTGFGFDAIKEEYKVVRICNWNYLMDVEIHMLGTENWRPIESPPYEVENEPYSPQQQVFVNGCFHWRTQYGEAAFVVALDISTEKFHTFLPPPKLCLHKYKEIELCNWKGQLGVIVESSGGSIHVWQLKNDNGGLWTQILTLPSILPERHLNIYDISGKYCRILDLGRFGGTSCHVGSIVSLKNIFKEEEKVKMIPKLGWINETSSSRKRKYRSPLEVKTEKSSCESQLPLVLRLNEADVEEWEDINSQWENMSEIERDSWWKDMCFHNPLASTSP